MPLNIADLAVSSPDIEAHGPIDPRHSADGDNLAPRLHVTGVPDGAAELAIVLHDPDAPLPHGFTHWTVYGVPAVEGEVDLSAARVGPNGIGQQAYSGPQPPAGHGVHHYYTWVYALDTRVDGEPSREDFLARYGDHVLEQNRLVATFAR